ncbi:uncharacterized protein LOC104881877 [Vitis vinifera]|uniref:uncharacterized protein LOC104881877 n=1 Tax=Vitis vinifera TaxID=29760 RepID=UPI0005401F9F|nr:uncharacterized protein LOC104881877 [Vitis vinifera]|eukprot:XP_010661682.1 PREDICTED: uncharacterized protein LOC104881877 [Vitis vinifera]
MATQPRVSSAFISFLTILGSVVLAKYQYDNVSPFGEHNIAMRISLFATFIYFMVVVVYEILNLDGTIKVEDDGRYLLILGHVRFLSGTIAATLLILILISYFGWFLLVIWTMFLVKIACYWDKPFYNFDMFKIKNQNTTNSEGGQEAQQPPV